MSLSTSTLRASRLAFAALVTLALGLILAVPAQGAGDPVKTGQLRLQLSSGFKQRLAAHRVSVAPKAFTIVAGTIDPIAGSGSVSLRGKLRFRHGGEKFVYKQLNARLGPGGALRSGQKKLFALSGGSVSRQGFGAQIDGVQLRFLRGAARKLRRELGAKGLRAGYAGSMVVSEQPATVEVLSGTATLTSNSGAGSVRSKLEAHCLDPDTGISPIAPATQPGGPGTPYVFPVTGGTISPEGIAGVVQQVGGFQLENGGSGLPAGCSASSTVTIRQSDLAVDFAAKHVRSLIAVSGPGAPFGLTGVFEVGFPYDEINATFTADPETDTVTSGGTALRLNSEAAFYLNEAFPQPSGSFDPAMQFSAGDTYGVGSLSLQVR